MIRRPGYRAESTPGHMKRYPAPKEKQRTATAAVQSVYSPSFWDRLPDVPERWDAVKEIRERCLTAPDEAYLTG